MVEPKTSIPFGWDSPTDSQNIVCQISFTGYLNSKFDPQTIVISVDKEKTQQVTITNEDDECEYITLKISIIGLRKTITFSKRE